MKINRLKSVVNQILIETSNDQQGYIVEPFYPYIFDYKVEK